LIEGSVEFGFKKIEIRLKMEDYAENLGFNIF
jgi:hypothetical protein